MAGPAVSVLLPRILDEVARASVTDLVASVAEATQGEDFWVQGRPFALSFGPELEGDLERRAAEGLEEALGWTPRDAVILMAMCNSEEDHRALAHLTEKIARKLDGVIDFGGMVLSEPCLDGGQPRSPVKVERPAGLHGFLVATTYETAAGAYATSHVGDPQFMKSWLRHPRFRMPK